MSALYRTHRPQDFAQFEPAQAHVVRTLRNAIEMDRVAHAYLFAGPRGTGKTSMAKILAKSLNCERGPTVSPCLVCEACRSIHDATSIDVIELDAASNRGIDDIREIVDKVAQRPAARSPQGVHRGRGPHAHQGGVQRRPEDARGAARARRLRALHHRDAVDAADHSQPLPAIRVPAPGAAGDRRGAASHRRDRVDRHRPRRDRTGGARAGGSFRDAVSTLDQLSTACDGRIGVADVRELLGTTDTEVLFQTLDLVADGDAGGCLRVIAAQVDGGADLATLVTDLLGHLRALFLCQQLGEPPEEVAATDDERARLLTQADRLQPATVHRLVDLLRDANDQVREGADPRLPLELALVRICRPAGELELQALEQRIARLEAGSPAPRPAAVNPTPVAPSAGPPTEEPSAPPPPPPPPPTTATDRQRHRPTWTSSPSSGATPSCPNSRAAPSRWLR